MKTLTKESLALKLNNCQIDEEISKTDEQEAKKNNLVVVFGASDDLIEFRGAINDEQGAKDRINIAKGLYLIWMKLKQGKNKGIIMKTKDDIQNLFSMLAGYQICKSPLLPPKTIYVSPDLFDKFKEIFPEGIRKETNQ